MKRFNLFISALLLIGACFMVSCTDKNDLDNKSSYTTVEVGLEFQKSSLIATKSGALIGDDGIDASDEVPYCDEEIGMTGTVVAKYRVEFIGISSSLPSAVWAWDVTDVTGGTDGMTRLSELMKIDFPTGATAANVIIEDFRVYTSSDKTLYDLDIDGDIVYNGSDVPTLSFITPLANSAYADYVTTPTEMTFTVDLYEKQYMKMEVLCFNEEVIPLFGFAWSDFEIITGDEICMFFNCQGTSAMSLHQVMAADVVASYFNGTNYVPYWEGQNYEYVDDEVTLPLSITPFCIPCPGNWDAQGFIVTVYPKNSSEAVMVTVDAAHIDAYLNDTPILDWSTTTYTGTIDAANDVNFIHYEFYDCYKPQAYYTDMHNNGATDVYAISWATEPSNDDFNFTHIFTVDDASCHIAMTPDESKLVLVDEKRTPEILADWGAAFYVYDIYSLKNTKLTFVEPDADDRGEPSTPYRFTQLVYIGEQLYAGCMTLDCLVPIIIDFNIGTFTYGMDIIDMSENNTTIENVSGGDLLGGYAADGSEILYSLTKAENGSVIKYWDFNGMESSEDQSSSYSRLARVTGACTIEGNTSAITSHVLNRTVSFKYWIDGTPTVISTELSDCDGGDMASAFNTLSPDEFTSIFGISF